MPRGGGGDGGSSQTEKNSPTRGRHLGRKTRAIDGARHFLASIIGRTAEDCVTNSKWVVDAPGELGIGCGPRCCWDSRDQFRI
jgi:hypothetical protein